MPDEGADVSAVVTDQVTGEAAHGRMAEAFARASAAHPEAVHVRQYLFAGRATRVRIVGDALAHEIGRAFAHLDANGAAPARPQLTIDLWDESATGIGCADGDAPLGPGEAERVTASPDGRFVLHRLPSSATGLDRARQHLVGRIAATERLTQYERGRPQHALLLRWLVDQGLQALHAGLVARQGKAVLIGGPSGAGKSSVALACLGAGLDYLADDSVGLEARDGVVLGHSLFCSAHLNPGHLARFPFLSAHGIPGRLPGEDKSLLVLSDLFPGQLGRVARVAGIVLPRVVGSDRSTLRPASKREAVLRLAPSTLCLLAHAEERRATLARIAQLVDLVPAYWLEVGGPVSDIPAHIDSILGEGGAA
jgi:hypothetical protein